MTSKHTLAPQVELGLFHASLGLCFINYTNADKPQVYAVAKDYYLTNHDAHQHYLETFNRAFHHLDAKGVYSK